MTTLDVCRANTFVAGMKGLSPKELNVPVIGGHAGITILPLLSQVGPPPVTLLSLLPSPLPLSSLSPPPPPPLPSPSPLSPLAPSRSRLLWPVQVPGVSFTQEELDALTVRIQFGGDEVVKAKAGAGSATLSMAYAGYLFTEGVIKAMKGEPVTMCAYVESSVTDASFFASPCKFGPNGVEEVLPFGELSAYEKGWFDKMLPELKAQIQKGIDFTK